VPAATAGLDASSAAGGPVAAVGSSKGAVAAGAVAVPRPATATKVAAASSPIAVSPDGAACRDPGAPLRLGQIGNFSGVGGPIAAGARIAVATWARAVNARGGVACHPVQLYSVDDGADPSRAASLVQDLVQNKGVQALVGVFSPLSFPGITSGIAKNRVPVVGGDGIDFTWTENPYLFPTGAGTISTVRGALRQIVRSGRTNVGLLYCVESTICTAAANAITPEVGKAGAKLTYSSGVSLAQTDYTAQCLNAKRAGVQVLGVALDGSSIGRVARSCAAIDYHPQFVTDGLVLSPENSADPDVRRNTLISTGAVAPWMIDDSPGQREYHAALAEYASNAVPNGASILGWAAGKLLEAAINGLGPGVRTRPITTADIFTGLGTVHRDTLGGLVPPMTFSPGQKAAPLIPCVYYELLTPEGWTAPIGNRLICD